MTTNNADAGTVANADKSPAPKAEKMSLMNRLSLWSFILLLMAVVITAIFPFLMPLTTLCVFMCSLNLLRVAWAIKKFEDETDDIGEERILLITCIICTPIVMYNSHDIAQWMATTVTAAPQAVWGVLVGVCDFVTNFFRHAFCGSLQ
jgi:hypothetical protein